MKRNAEMPGNMARLLRPEIAYFVVIPEDDPARLTDALLTIDLAHAQLPTWGKHSQELAAPYATANWVDRWQALLYEVVAAKNKNTSQRQREVSPLDR